MAGITLAQAQTQLDAWLAASLAIANNQSYSIETGGTQRTLTRANAAWINRQITYWNGQVKKLSRTRSGRTKYVVPA